MTIESSKSEIPKEEHVRADQEELQVQGAVPPIESGAIDAGAEQALFQDELSLTEKIEAILFASPDPIKNSEILDIIDEPGLSVKVITEKCESLLRFYKEKGGGFRLINDKGSYQFQTVPAASPLMERLFSKRPRPLSKAANETLAIIAYRQPVTRADIEFIRGVDAGSIIKNLLERELIQCVGRKDDSPGKPMLFGTSQEFLKVYRLKSLNSLPPLDSFQPPRENMEQAIEKIKTKQDITSDELLNAAAHDTNTAQ